MKTTWAMRWAIIREILGGTVTGWTIEHPGNEMTITVVATKEFERRWKGRGNE